MTAQKRSVRLAATPLAATVTTLWLALAPVPLAAQTLRIRTPERPCVLLKNDNVLFGDAYQLGQFVLVRTAPDDELRLPRSEVACWAKSLADLYQYRLDQRSEDNLESHLRDARWCIEYELFDQAADQIQAAKVIAPDDPTVHLLEGQLRRHKETIGNFKQPAGSVATTGFRQDLDQRDVVQASQIDPAMLSLFASQVQPLLINRCGRCHDQRSERRWQLLVPPSGTRATARMTRENLAAALRFVDRGNPQQSSLLIMATSPHGGENAPLNVRTATALDAFKRWLLFQPGESTRRSPLRDVDRGGANPNDRTAVEPQSAVAPTSFTAQLPAASAMPIAASIESDQPKRLPVVDNPLDPSLFNRRYHRQEK